MLLLIIIRSFQPIVTIQVFYTYGYVVWGLHLDELCFLHGNLNLTLVAIKVIGLRTVPGLVKSLFMYLLSKYNKGCECLLQEQIVNRTIWCLYQVFSTQHFHSLFRLSHPVLPFSTASTLKFKRHNCLLHPDKFPKSSFTCLISLTSISWEKYKSQSKIYPITFKERCKRLIAYY